MNPLSPHSIRVAIDVGSARHFVAVGLPDGKILEEFNIGHDRDGFTEFFRRIDAIEQCHQLPRDSPPVASAMKLLRMKVKAKVGEMTFIAAGTTISAFWAMIVLRSAC